MRLSALIADTGVRAPPPAPDPEVVGLTADSRQVRPGMLFAALPGRRADGRAFIQAALDAGAVAILAPEGTGLPAAAAGSAVLLAAADPRRALARLAARFHGRQPAVIAAVTGTNGKSSTVHFLRQLWSAAGQGSAALGTLGLTGPVLARPGALTTPDPVALHALLAEAAAAGVSHLAMEASSHGLDQRRLDGVAIRAAAFTNLSRDHLDYHGSMEAYLAAKARLFAELLPAGAPAVLNADSPHGPALAAIARERGLEVIDFGQGARRLRLAGRAPGAEGQRLDLVLEGRAVSLALPLVGAFQAMNALAALGLALATGTAPEAALAALERLEGAPGRLERVAAGNPARAPMVIVDYAHTPDALEQALTALRPHTEGRLVCVFGCGGDRDPGKRPLMAAVAARLADRVVVTDDNPRTENAPTIRAEVMAGLPPGARAIEIGDRAEAISHAIATAAPSDLVLIAGKGHESGQIIPDGAGGTMTLPFDDRLVAAAVLADRPREPTR